MTVATRRRLLLLAGVLPLAILAAWLWTPDGDRGALEARYATPADFRIVDGLRLHLRDRGPRSAPALLLLHGFGSSLHTWAAWEDELTRTHRVVMIDLPGAGLTGAEPERDYSDARGVRLLRALLDSLGIARASLIGNSLGGRLAWTFAAREPTRVDRLVLISPDGFESDGFAYGVAPDVPPFVSAMRYVLPQAVLAASLRPAFADPARLTDSIVTRYHELLLAPGVRTALLDRLRQSILVPPEPLLGTIRAPTLLLWGTHDSLIPYRNAAQYLAAMPNARLHALPRVGHLPQEESPAAALTAVRRFLGR